MDITGLNALIILVGFLTLLGVQIGFLFLRRNRDIA